MLALYFSTVKMLINDNQVYTRTITSMLVSHCIMYKDQKMFLFMTYLLFTFEFLNTGYDMPLGYDCK